MDAGDAWIARIIMLVVIGGGIALLVFVGTPLGIGAVFIGLVGLLFEVIERGPALARPRPVSAEAGWSRARQRLDSVSTQYAAYECDPQEVLRLPALADVTVPSTARFVAAFANAQALRTDAPPRTRDATDFIAAVKKTERAWREAREAAHRIELGALSLPDRAAVTRIRELLIAALDRDSEPERRAAYVLARAELRALTVAGRIRIPEPAQAALDAAARGELAP